MIWQSSKNYSNLFTLDTKSRQQCRVRDQEYVISFYPQSTYQYYHLGSKHERYKGINMINMFTFFDL